MDDEGFVTQLYEPRIAQSDAYRKARSDLRAAELELMRNRERVAEMRRSLPLDTVVDDYAFTEGPSSLDADEPVRNVRLSELFSAPDRTLIVYQFMYGKAQTEPCPLCTMWIDGYNAAAPHVTQRADFVLLAAADLPALRAHARNRGWDNLRVVSAGDTTFKYDTGSEEADGEQLETVTVFTKATDGSMRLVYSNGAQLSEDVRERGIDLLSPVWHLFDLTPEGRGDWYPKLDYS